MSEKEMILKRTKVVCLLAMVCCFLWGSAFPCVKIGYDLFKIGSTDTASQILFAGMRFALAGILTILIGSVLNRKVLLPSKGSWHMVWKLSMCQTVIQYVLFYIGLANTTGVKASIIEASNVFFAIGASVFLLRDETMKKKKFLGCVLGFAGVVLINLNGTGLNGGMRFQGEGFILLSTISYAFSSIMIKKYSQKEEPVILSGYQFLLGGLIMTAAGFFMGGRVENFTVASVALLVYMALISAVAYSLWGILLKYNPVGKVTVFGFMNPLFGVLLSAFLLGEKNQAFTMQGFISLILVCMGIYMVNKEQG